MRRTAAVASMLLAMSAGALAQTPISMWVHSGPGPEAAAYADAIRAFNQSQSDLRVNLVRLPEGTYNDQINAAALARKLPCLLDFDGPHVYNYAWVKKIIPLDGFPELVALHERQLPSLRQQGRYNGRLYTLAQFDAGLALWANRRLLERAGLRIPVGVEDAWSLPEFEDALARLKAAGVAYPLDMKFNYGGEWFSFGFAPLLQSAGADLVARGARPRADGFINSPAAVAALERLQRWSKAGFVNVATKDDADFIKGVSALSYVGHWTHRSYRDALGDDLILLPMPRLGERAVTGAGSWNFGISSDCKTPEAAARVLSYLMSPQEIARVTAANGAVPGTIDALAMSRDHAPNGALALYSAQINAGLARVRPQTPAYPVISMAFAEAINNIAAGADVKSELDKAARRIDENIADNKGYPTR